MQTCTWCNGSGERAVATSPDDFDVEYCDCPAGSALEEKESQWAANRVPPMSETILGWAKQLRATMRNYRFE